MEANNDNQQESRRWHVVLAIWTIYFMETGLMKGFGVLLPALLDQFDTYTHTIGVVVSLTMVFGNALSLAAKPLTRIVEGRTIVMACAVITTVGLILDSLAANIFTLTLGMILVGFSSIGSTIVLGMLSSYFTKYFTSNTFIVTTGSPLSVMVFAPMTQLFLDIWGWRGAMLLLGGVNLHCVAAAAILKRLPVEHSQNTSNNESDVRHKENNESDLRHEENNVSDLRHEGNNKNSTLNGTNDESTCSQMVQIKENKTFFHEIFNTSLFMNSCFMTQLFIYTIYGFVLNGWIVYLVTILQSKGLSPYQSAIVATTSGLGSLVIRIILAIVPGGPRRNRQVYYIGSLIVPLIFTGFYFAVSYLALCTLGFLLGNGVGIIGTLVYVVVKYCIKTDDSVSAVAWLNLLNGLGYLAGGYITGWLYDQSLNFDNSLIVLSAVSATMLVALALEDILKIRNNNRRKPITNRNNVTAVNSPRWATSISRRISCSRKHSKNSP